MIIVARFFLSAAFVLPLFAGLSAQAQSGWQPPYVPSPGEPPRDRIYVPIYPPGDGNRDRGRTRLYSCHARDQDGRRYSGIDSNPAVAQQAAMNLCSLGGRRCTPIGCY